MLIPKMKRNVLYFIYGLGEGGAEHQMLQLAERMKSSGHRVHIACLLRQGDLLAEAEAIVGHEVPGFPITSFYNQTMIEQLRRFAGYLRQNEVEVVHAQDFYSNIFGMIGAALARVPVRIAFKGETEFSRTPAQKFAERCSFRFANAVVANAEAVRNQLLREGVESQKLLTIYNGIDLRRVAPTRNRSREDLLTSFGLPSEPGRRFVTIVANLQHPVKDHPMFLRAAQKVHDAIPNVSFVVAGQGKLKEELKAFASELNLKDEVFFIGRCDRVGDLLSVSDVGVLSSKAEGFSNSILEYMAAALPVVATDVGGAKEVVIQGTTGYLVPSGDADAMSARLIGLLREPKLARAMGESGRELVARKFSWNTQVGILQELYERVLINGKPAANGH